MAGSQRQFVLGFEDEVWWSREAQPAMHSWCQDTPLRLQQLTVAKSDPDAKAVACYGLYVPADQQMLLRFVEGRPVSAVTCSFLAWLLAHFTAQHKRALFVIWDNASWHLSHEVRTWVKAYNREAKRTGACRLILCRLPSKSPWLNAIEPKWVHGKRAVAEPARLLSVNELMQRVCDYYHVPLTDPIARTLC